MLLANTLLWDKRPSWLGQLSRAVPPRKTGVQLLYLLDELGQSEQVLSRHQDHV
jgi:hypothetical protein